MITLVSEHPEFLIVDKPPGKDFHNDENKLGFFNEVKRDLGLQQLWPVHRLDKPTSGLLILAKSKTAAQQLSASFAEQKVDKRYLALSGARAKKKQGKIHGDMVRSRRGGWRLERRFNNPAITLFHSTSLVPGKRLYYLMPKTGKTHQLRVAMKSISAPILGDQTYGGEQSDRLYLHAYHLAFKYDNRWYQWQRLPSIGEQFSIPQLPQAVAELEAASSGVN